MTIDTRLISCCRSSHGDTESAHPVDSYVDRAEEAGPDHQPFVRLPDSWAEPDKQGAALVGGSGCAALGRLRGTTSDILLFALILFAPLLILPPPAPETLGHLVLVTLVGGGVVASVLESLWKILHGHKVAFVIM